MKNSTSAKVMIIIGLSIAAMGSYILKRPEKFSYYKNKLKENIEGFKRKF